MGILEVIYNNYCEGRFTVRMPEHTASDNIKIMSIEKMFDMSPQQISSFFSPFSPFFNCNCNTVFIIHSMFSRYFQQNKRYYQH